MSYHLDCCKVRESREAILLQADDFDTPQWVPLSQIESMHFNVNTQTGHVVLSDWIAKKLGLG